MRVDPKEVEWDGPVCDMLFKIRDTIKVTGTENQKSNINKAVDTVKKAIDNDKITEKDSYNYYNDEIES